MKLWRKLQRTKYRRKEGLFIAEGERCVEQIMSNGFVEVEALVVQKGYQAGFNVTGAVFEVAPDDFETLSDTDSPQGVLAVCKIPEESISDQLHTCSGVLVALDAVQDPGNVGTIIRTAAWFGAAGMLFGNGTADPFHPKVVRSTAGATGSLPYLKGDLAKLLVEFEKLDWKSYLMDGGDGSVSIKTETPANKSIIVIGNEGNGISQLLFADHRKRIRILGDDTSVESLNAAIALGIGLYRFTQTEN